MSKEAHVKTKHKDSDSVNETVSKWEWYKIQPEWNNIQFYKSLKTIPQ